ncbi:MAG: hypothetical protein GY749_26920, partial [Desulfobacteraceae bacterium]|nr:hypothetical protein [Desulfobacteraceae bacterium]
IGPVANMVMEDAFESIGTDNPDNLEFFSESLIIELQNAVCQQIDEKEAGIIKELVSEYLKALNE